MFDASAGCPKHLLETLSCINQEHVIAWFHEHTKIGEGEGLYRCKELFGKAKCRPMMEIERQLKHYHRELQRGGP